MLLVCKVGLQSISKQIQSAINQVDAPRNSLCDTYPLGVRFYVCMMYVLFDKTPATHPTTVPT